jgi:hypothetical protein
LGCIFDLAVSLRVNSNEHRRNRSRHVVSVDAGEEHDQAEECDGIKERSYGKKQAAILEADGRRKGKGTHAIEGGMRQLLQARLGQQSLPRGRLLILAFHVNKSVFDYEKNEERTL